jgi:hypothetical protein
MKAILKRLWNICQTPQPTQVRLSIETLENRLVPSVAAGPQGEVYATFGAKDWLYKLDTTGNWNYMQASGVTSVAVGANGTVAAVFNDSSLKEYNPTTNSWSLVDTDVGVATVGPQGQLYYTHGTAEQLWERDTPTATPFIFADKTGITSLSAGANGTVDAVFADGSVGQLVGGTTGQWTTLWGSAMLTAAAAGPHGETYLVAGSNHSLYSYTQAAGWQYLNADNVASLSVGANGTLDAIFSNGEAWQWDPATGSWGASDDFWGANTDPAGPTLGQTILQYGLDHKGLPTADPSLPYTCADFAAAALHFAGANSTENYGVSGMDPSLDYVWGNLVLQQQAGASPANFNQVQPGDILQFRNVASTVSTSSNGSTSTYSWSFPQHTAIVYQNLGNGRLTLLEQNFNEQKFVTVDTIDLSGMTSGTVWVYQPVAKQ